MSDPRVAPLPESEWDDETREVMAAVLATPGGQPLHIFTTFAHHPKLLKRWLVFGSHVMLKSTLTDRDRELLILRTAWNCRADYEWGQHVAIARDAGIPDADIARVAVPDTGSWDPAEAALLRAADELHADARIGDATWNDLAARYDTQQLLDLIFTVGQYHLVAFALNTLRVQREPGVPGLPN